MPKILQIVVEGNRGSTGTIANAIGQMVIDKGWESYIAFGRYKRPSNSNLIKIGNTFDILLHGIETRLFDRHGLGSRRATKYFIQEINNLKPDLIHLHHIHGYYINYEILFKYLKKVNIPIVWTFHDCWSFTGHCGFFDSVGCEKWKTECFQCPQSNEYPISWLTDRSKQNFLLKKSLFTSIPNLTVISVSKWLDNLVSQSFFKNTKHFCIYNGIDQDIFKPKYISKQLISKYDLENKFIILGVATTWEKRKGLKDFITLSNLLNKNEVIVLIGLNNSQKLDLPNNIIGISRTESKSELADFYNIADVFLNLSVEETFGLTTIEAMACGTPVIVYNRTASPELVTDDTGIVVEKNNYLNLYSSINKIKSKGKEYYSLACRNRVLDNFCEINRYKEYIELYKKLII
jgi:putative colanic acid biosynthesis glycosyltransferase